jgi:hypothetical protein
LAAWLLVTRVQQHERMQWIGVRLSLSGAPADAVM